jgi:hypothetical protein
MPETPDSSTPAARSVVLVLRLALLLLAAGALATAVVVGETQDSARLDSRAMYVCPMHPEVTAGGPGVCPICRMVLEPVNAGGAGAASAAINASTYQTYDTVRWRGYGPDDRSPASVVGDGAIAAILYRDELAAWAPEQKAVFFPASVPGAEVEVRATSEAPEPWDRSTSRVLFRTEAAAPPLAPGQVGWSRLATRPRGPPVIPYSAILEGAEGPYVLVVSPDGRTLTKRPVEIGRVFGGVAAVLSGLRASERVLIRSAFFLDAERRLRGEAALEVAP